MCTARLIANPVSHKLKAAPIDELLRAAARPGRRCGGVSVRLRARLGRPQMRIERLDLAEVARLGGPRGAAAHVRALVPDGASVEEAVREIVDRVRAEGDAAVREYTRRFDTAGNEPKPLVVAPEELDAAIKELPLELVAGLQVAIANVATVAAGGRRRESGR